MVLPGRRGNGGPIQGTDRKAVPQIGQKARVAVAAVRGAHRKRRLAWSADSIAGVSDLELLGTVELFEELEPDELDHISDAAATRILNRGDVLFTEGDEPHDLFVVVSG